MIIERILVTAVVPAEEEEEAVSATKFPMP